MNAFLALLLLVLLGASTYAASVGVRGKVLHRDYYGAQVPDRVVTDPQLRATANRAFAVWCSAGALLLVAPIVWLFSDFTRERAVWELVILAAYVFVAVVVSGYPFEKIKRL